MTKPATIAAYKSKAAAVRKADALGTGYRVRTNVYAHVGLTDLSKAKPFEVFKAV